MKYLKKLIKDKQYAEAKAFILDNQSRIEEITDCILEIVDEKSPDILDSLCAGLNVPNDLYEVLDCKLSEKGIEYTAKLKPQIHKIECDVTIDDLHEDDETVSNFTDFEEINCRNTGFLDTLSEATSPQKEMAPTKINNLSNTSGMVNINEIEFNVYDLRLFHELVDNVIFFTGLLTKNEYISVCEYLEGGERAIIINNIRYNVLLYCPILIRKSSVFENMLEVGFTLMILQNHL